MELSTSCVAKMWIYKHMEIEEGYMGTSKNQYNEKVVNGKEVDSNGSSKTVSI